MAAQERALGLKIVVVRGVRSGTEIALEGAEVFLVGSSAGAQVKLPDPGVRPEHARIFVDGDRLILVEPSGEGVAVNGRRETQAELKHGDQLAVGAAVLRVDTGAGAAPAAAAGRAHVVILKGPDEGKSFRLDKRTTLGRGTTADFPLLDMKCSREHCAIEPQGAGYVVLDLGSTNGTRLNETKLEAKQPQALKTGDKIRLGATILEFHGADAPPPAPRPASPQAPQAGKTFEIDLGDLDSPAAIPIPSNDSERRGAVTQRVQRPTSVRRKVTVPDQPALRTGPAPTLSGDLDKMGFAQVVQFLNLQGKTGELVVRSVSGEFGLGFGAGVVVDAWGPPSSGLGGEPAFHAIARLRRGHFEFHETSQARPTRITQGTLALLMEAMRLVDEATDPGD